MSRTASWIATSDVVLLAGIPIKPFGVAKARLAPLLDAPARARLGKAVAAHTAQMVAAAGATPVIVTGDDDVEAWANGRGLAALREIPGAGLDGAARTVAARASELSMRWAIVHADLPLVTPSDLRAVFEAVTEGTVIAPAHDGGTNALAGSGSGFPFAYGAGSYHRHLAAAPSAAVIVRAGLAHDLDTPGDLALIAGHRNGRWLRAKLPAGLAIPAEVAPG